LGRTPRELEDTLYSDELTELAILNSIDPFGDDRADWNTAAIRLSVLEPHLKENANVTLADLKLDFLGERKEQQPQQTAEQVEAELKAWLRK